MKSTPRVEGRRRERRSHEDRRGNASAVRPSDEGILIARARRQKLWLLVRRWSSEGVGMV